MKTPTRKEIEESFGYRLREERMERDLTHAALADQVNALALKSSEEKALIEAEKAELEAKISGLNTQLETLRSIEEIQKITVETVRTWEAGREVPDAEQTQILATVLFGEGDSKEKTDFIALANKARGQSVRQRIMDQAVNPHQSFAAALGKHLDGLTEIVVEEINKAQNAEIESSKADINTQLAAFKEQATALDKKTPAAPDLHLTDGDGQQHRVILSEDDRRDKSDLLIAQALYFIEAGLLPSAALYALITEGLENKRPLGEARQTLDAKYQAQVNAIGEEKTVEEPKTERPAELPKDPSEALREYASLHAEIYHKLGYVAQESSRGSKASGVKQSPLHKNVAESIGRSRLNMHELSPMNVEKIGQHSPFFSDADIDKLIQCALPEGVDASEFKTLCHDYNEAKKRVASQIESTPENQREALRDEYAALFAGMVAAKNAAWGKAPDQAISVDASHVAAIAVTAATAADTTRGAEDILGLGDDGGIPLDIEVDEDTPDSAPPIAKGDKPPAVQVTAPTSQGLIRDGKATAPEWTPPPIPTEKDKLLKEYATVLSGIYAITGMLPPTTDSSDRQNQLSYKAMASNAGRSKAYIPELTPFELKPITTKFKTALLGAAQSTAEHRAMTQLLDRLEAITPAVQGLLEQMPEKKAFDKAAKKMLDIMPNGIKSLFDHGDAKLPVNAKADAQRLIDGELDLGDKLDNYFNHVSPARRSKMESSNKRVSYLPDVEPEIKAFKDAHQKLHETRRKLYYEFDQEVEFARSLVETQMEREILPEESQEMLEKSIDWLADYGLIDPEIKNLVTFADRISKKGHSGGHDGRE